MEDDTIGVGDGLLVHVWRSDILNIRPDERSLEDITKSKTR